MYEMDIDVYGQIIDILGTPLQILLELIHLVITINVVRPLPFS